MNLTQTETPNQESTKSLYDDYEFSITSLILLVTVVLSIASYLRIYDLNFILGPYRLAHWLSWIGTLFIAIYTPAYFWIKRKYPGKIRTILRIHIYGNLLSFMLITVHFTQQISRPQAFFPNLSTGLLLYIVMPILVLTGYLHRFKIIKRVNPHANRYLHVSLTVTFYLTIIVHILQGLHII